MSRLQIRQVLMGGLLAILLFPAAALGEQVCTPANWKRAQELSRDTMTFIREKRFDEAMAAALTAWNICPHPQIQGLIGRVHQEAGRLDKALVAYRACMDDADKEEVRRTCSQRVEAIEAEIAAGKAGTAAALEPAPATPSPAAPEAAVGAPNPPSDVPSSVAASDGRTVEPPAPAETPIKMVRAPAFARKTAGNWVGIWTSVAAVGVGVLFLTQYGIDRSDAQDMHWDADQQGWWAADEVGSRNLIIGASLTAAGLVGGILSATLWPKIPVRPEVVPAEGGGVVGVSVGLR